VTGRPDLEGLGGLEGLEGLEGLGELAASAAEAAGALLLAHARDVHLVEAKSSATDPVSEADRASEALLVRLLTRARPDDGLLGEEGADRASPSGYRWVLDPLDGTVNYLYGHVGWSVSVACEQRMGDGWQAVAGAVHDPVHGETFTAVRGGGARLGHRVLRVNDPVPLAAALVATGFGYGVDDRHRQAATVAALLPRVRDIRRVGSAALDLCAVAAGRVDAYGEDTPARWDWAAGALIAAEAGARVTVLGAPASDLGILASGPALHDELLAAWRPLASPSA